MKSFFILKGEFIMGKNLKEFENYCSDRTYQNNAGSGTIRVKKISEKIKIKNNRFKSKTTTSKLNSRGQSFNHALISTRRTKDGYKIIVTRQLNTSNEAFGLAKKFQIELMKELGNNNYFVNDDDNFKKWFTEKEEILKNNNFHKLKD